MIRFILADTDPIKFYFGSVEDSHYFTVPDGTKIYTYDFNSIADAKKSMPFWFADFDTLGSSHAIGNFTLELQ